MRPHPITTGQRFGRWIALSPSEVSPDGSRWWACRCDCGTERLVPARALFRGKSRSCGCLRRERSAAWHKLHAKHGMRGSPEYVVWRNMWSRCANPKHKSFSYYGGRGITVCPKWRDFMVFLNSMGERPFPGASIDRIDNELGYSPTNCRWVSAKEQARNRRGNRVLAWNGISLTFAEWAERSGISSETLRRRLNLGWSVSRALTTPLRYHR
jgi:hypothetical protein